MAEVLVKNAPHWMDAFKPADIRALTPQELADFNARTQRGDIIVAKADGCVWGTSEGLPDFVVFKLPGVPLEDVLYLIQEIHAEAPVVTDPDTGELIVGVGTLLKRRKYQVPKSYMDQAVAAGGALTIPNAQTLIANLIAKVS